jgi:hypothetical protein
MLRRRSKKIKLKEDQALLLLTEEKERERFRVSFIDKYIGEILSLLNI